MELNSASAQKRGFYKENNSSFLKNEAKKLLKTKDRDQKRS